MNMSNPKWRDSSRKEKRLASDPILITVWDHITWGYFSFDFVDIVKNIFPYVLNVCTGPTNSTVRKSREETSVRFFFHFQTLSMRYYPNEL